MALMEWQDKYSVQIASIDEQHKKLISLLNSLHDAMKSGKGQAVMGPILNELINYTVSHFKHEEDFFTQYGYVDAFRHKREHADLTAKALDLKKKFDSGGLLTMEVMDFLKGWLNTHILGSDMKYSSVLKEKGAK